MAWLRTLAETYDIYSAIAGADKNNQAVLLPISHSTFNAQIEVTIDEDGNFRGAKKLDKGKDVVTIIPVTEDSASRGNGNFPHALCDKLCYIAGDYTFYTDDDKREYFDTYIKQLQDWAESEDSHPMVRAVYQYLQKGSLIQDLVAGGTLELDEEGRLTDKGKIQGLGQTGANVRFVIRGSSMPQEVWKNPELYERYSAYYQQKTGERKLCYVSGKVEPCSEKHPSKIRNTADKAKLISGNDESGFTYRGRFVTKDQAASIGYDTSQKAHNALRWLIQKQGYTRDEAAIVCWMVNRPFPLPDIMEDSVHAFDEIDEFDMDFAGIDAYEASGADKHDTGKYFARQFVNAVNGYAEKIQFNDKVAVIALDAATTGRLSVAYYDEMGGRQYMDAILNWQQHCRWRRSVKVGKAGTDTKRITCECTPSPREMALAAFGVQRTEWLEADSKLIRNTVKRLLPCITRQGIRIPTDIIRAAAQRASMPQAMKNEFLWKDVLCVTCAMIRYNYERGSLTMEHFLEDRINDRNVLFGRLLAVYDYMEQRAMYEYDENGKVKESRTTNAKRYWNAYSSRPARTAKTIQQNLIAYEKRLKGFWQKQFEEWEQEIMIHFTAEDFSNIPLSEFYLPGYYQQMEYMKKAFWKKDTAIESEEE